MMVNRSDRDPPSLNDCPSFELSGEMRRGSAKSIRARRLRLAKQAGYKPAASSVGHHTEETLHIGRRPYKPYSASSTRGNHMNFGCPTAAGFADRLGPVFFRAPVPSG